uniref:MRG domain-containing protein n=1 Tax=Lygus hesperus TaxID=30085 RepID=A0A0K8TGJ2_LYGHE
MIAYSLSQIRLMCHRRGHLRPSAGKKGSNVTVDSITRSANLCREVADSLRVFMEFGLSRMFLYEEEKEQYSHVIRSRETPLRNESPIDLDDDFNHDEKPTDCDDGNEGEARRKTLRSHSGGSCNSQEIDTKPDLATLLTNDCLNDGGETLALRPMSLKENEALKKILSRKLVQDSYRAQKHPSTVYGAVHISRVLVKMPDVLSNAEYGEPKLSLLVEYLNNFMKYLEEHPEWFGDNHYIEKPPSSLTS